ncbi:PAS-domain containing protein [Hahella ganghwensis]|uniref:PAS-domain containing protein n=1 Tax=Hahella ganghwensis TaxID=286420 RepID=UPI00035F64C6|nr:PAS-domain containing protein [Hahella ganghwensis]
MLSIKTRSLWTLLVLALLTLSMGLVGWLVTRQTADTVYRFESLTLPEISTALNLSEGVAQLAALSPYVADAARPFLLQNERLRLEKKFNELKLVAANIRDERFRSELESRLDKLFGFVSELIEVVEDELFLREDVLALRFDIDDLADYRTSTYAGEDSSLALLHSTLKNLTRPDSLKLANPDAREFAEAESAASQISEDNLKKSADRLLSAIRLAHQRLAEFRQRKPYLIASIRAQSEELTHQVNLFVGDLQKSVVRQRQTVSEAVKQGQGWILLMSLLMLSAFIYSARFNYGVTRDLEAVTRDMTRLAQGDTDTPEPTINRSDEIGELASSFSVFRRDALQMRQVSQDLKAQSKLLETVFNQIHDGLSVFSRDQRLIAWNRRYLEIFDLSADDVRRNMSLSELQEMMSRQPHRNLSIDRYPIDMADLNLARLQSAQTFERHFDNGKVVEFRSQPMPEGGFVTLYRDLTERRTMEQQLIQAQKMEVLGQLTGGVAHDFNNLLAAILGNLQLLNQSTDLQDSQQQQIHRALRVTEKGVSLVQRLLAFSRKQQLYPEITNVDELLEGMLDLVEYSVGQNIEVTTDLQAPGYKVFVDPSQLENAILNLALNSSAAMSDGGKLIFRTRIRNPQAHQGNEKSQLILTVIDTGTGIPQELQERILEPFFTTKPVGKGSGLGLSMVYGFVSQSGGHLSIDSSRNWGTHISLVFPLEEQEPLTAHAEQTLAIHLRLPASGQIALVEDDPDVQATIAQQFESFGLKTDCYSRAEDLLKLLFASSSDTIPLPDLVVTDINLQGSMNGVEFFRECQQRFPELNVVMTSGMPREILESRYGLHPEDPLLPKPISQSTLQKIIQII